MRSIISERIYTTNTIVITRVGLLCAVKPRPYARGARLPAPMRRALGSEGNPFKPKISFFFHLKISWCICITPREKVSFSSAEHRKVRLEMVAIPGTDDVSYLSFILARTNEPVGTVCANPWQARGARGERSC